MARRLSLWLSGGVADDLLWRSAMSGGRATLQFKRDNKLNRRQSGDLSAIGQGAYEFCEQTYIECKHYRDLQIDRSLLCCTGQLYHFWQKTVVEARRYDKRPLLIARQNRYPTLAITDTGMFGKTPVLTVNSWLALVYLFDEVTKVRRPLRRGLDVSVDDRLAPLGD